MTPINPSPTPWSHDDNRPGYEGSYMVFDAEGKPVAYFGDMEDNTGTDISNARLIVQCVNAHAALLEASRAAWGHLKTDALCAARAHDREVAQIILDKLQAAIAAAEATE